MTKDDSEYTLNFVIPQGPTGPGNPQDICFISFAESRVSGRLKVENSIVMPDNSNIFTVSTDSFTIQKNGIYEITFCGVLEEVGDNKGGVINLADAWDGSMTMVSDMSGMISPGTPSVDFSETTIIRITQAPRVFIVQLGNFGKGTIIALSVNVVVKRLGD